MLLDPPVGSFFPKKGWGIPQKQMAPPVIRFLQEKNIRRGFWFIAVGSFFKKNGREAPLKSFPESFFG